MRQRDPRSGKAVAVCTRLPYAAVPATRAAHHRCRDTVRTRARGRAGWRGSSAQGAGRVAAQWSGSLWASTPARSGARCRLAGGRDRVAHPLDHGGGARARMSSPDALGACGRPPRCRAVPLQDDVRLAQEPIPVELASRTAGRPGEGGGQDGAGELPPYVRRGGWGRRRCSRRRCCRSTRIWRPFSRSPRRVPTTGSRRNATECASTNQNTLALLAIQYPAAARRTVDDHSRPRGRLRADVRGVGEHLGRDDAGRGSHTRYARERSCRDCGRRPARGHDDAIRLRRSLPLQGLSDMGSGASPRCASRTGWRGRLTGSMTAWAVAAPLHPVACP